MITLVFCYLPLVVLITLMVKKEPLPSSKALPLSALLAYIIVLGVFHNNATLVHANVLSGALLALTPLSIIAGAIFLFKCMEITGALGVLRQALDSISANPIAQLMIVGWAFAFLIEGASGFGTPAAIAAPILFGLGFSAFRIALFCLVLNSIPVTFGAMGTPIWFGLSILNLPQNTILLVAQQAALINTCIAPIIVVLALRMVITDTKAIGRNIGFILISTFACTIPYLTLSYIGVEFPSLLGGLIGLIVTIAAAKYKIGLTSPSNTKTNIPPPALLPIATLLKAAFPLWGTVLLLVLTRLPDVGLKMLLQATEPAIEIQLGFLGTLSVSQSLVLNLSNILNTTVSWQHSLLYVPSIIPFGVIGLLTLWLFRNNSQKNQLKDATLQTLSRIKTPFWALLGALIFVNMMMLGDHNAPVAQIGHHLASLSGDNWAFFAPLLGVLGSFFSGSATISNLTFAGIQATISEQLSLPLTTILALQSVGAAIGNMVCINNIVAVTAILGLKNQDGELLKRTAIMMAIFAALAGILGAVLITFDV